MQETSQQPRVIKLLVDCSGSMSGDSIGQARVALLNIVDSLNEQDYFSFVRFGSSVVQDVSTPLQATKANVIKIRNSIAKMDANLGGTEIFSALRQTLLLSSEIEQADLLLITDGAVWDNSGGKSQTDNIIKLANKTQQRIFTIGVGSSVSERLVRELAVGTAGACELVHPDEGMAEKIERHFKRIYARQAISTQLEWPVQPIWQTPIKQLFMGDRLYIFAKFQEQPQGKVALHIDFGQGQLVQQSVEITTIEAYTDINRLARLVANERLKVSKNHKDKVALALKYRLPT